MLNTTVPHQQSRNGCSDCSARNRCIMHYLNAGDRQHIRVTSRRFSKGRHLLHQGDNVSLLHTVKSGCAKSSTNFSSGEEATLNFYFSGDTIGLDSLVSATSPADIVALQDSMVCSYDLQAIKKASETTPALQDYILTSFTTAMSQAHQLSMVASAERRVAAFITRLAEHQVELGYSRAEFLLPMSRLEIANYLRLAHETVSRVLGSLRRQRFLDVKDRTVQILHYDKLATLADGARL